MFTKRKIFAKVTAAAASSAISTLPHIHDSIDEHQLQKKVEECLRLIRAGISKTEQGMLIPLRFISHNFHLYLLEIVKPLLIRLQFHTIDNTQLDKLFQELEVQYIMGRLPGFLHLKDLLVE